jgi:hypothetical protein
VAMAAPRVPVIQHALALAEGDEAGDGEDLTDDAEGDAPGAAVAVPAAPVAPVARPVAAARRAFRPRGWGAGGAAW